MMLHSNEKIVMEKKKEKEARIGPGRAGRIAARRGGRMKKDFFTTETRNHREKTFPLALWFLVSVVNFSFFPLHPAAEVSGDPARDSGSLLLRSFFSLPSAFLSSSIMAGRKP